MSKTRSRPDIEALLADRAKYEAWLDQLAEKAAKMPEHVVSRVRADYAARLDKVLVDLGARADTLRSESASLEERLAALDTELTAKRDARAEDELRALVGEFDEGVWERKAREHDSGIEALESERSARQGEHVHVREMLAEAVRPVSSAHGTQPEPEAAEAAPPAPDALAADAAGDVALESRPEVSSGTEPEAQAFADAEPVPPAEPEPQASPPVEPSAESMEAEPELPLQLSSPRRPSPFDEIGFLRTVVGRATPFPTIDNGRPVMPALPLEQMDAAPEPLAAPEPQVPPPSIPDPEPIIEIADRPLATPVRGSSFTVPPALEDFSRRSRADTPPELRLSGSGEAQRTLKCQECGWMNLPTEWYCEKCGGELAAF